MAGGAGSPPTRSGVSDTGSSSPTPWATRSCWSAPSASRRTRFDGGRGRCRLFRQLDDVTRRIKEDQDKLQALEEVLNARRRELGELIKTRSDEVKWSRFRPDYLRNFIEEPTWWSLTG